jgi:hypothetical protein
MARMSKRFVDRFKANFRKYQKVLAAAKARDVNESDTVVIVSDFLGDVLGYDKYQELTTEFAIRSTFCDLAVRVDGRLSYLIEVKSVGTDLKDNHLRQAVDYGAKDGCEWVVLTNGVEWQAHRIRFEQPVNSDHVFTVNLLDEAARPAQIASQLYLLSKEGGTADMDRYFRQRQVTSRYVLAQVLLHDNLLASLRRELRRLSPEVKVSTDELRETLEAEVLKRELLEGDRAIDAVTLVKKLARRRARRESATEKVPAEVGSTVPASPAAPGSAP